jgi:hypothetical protein
MLATFGYLVRDQDWFLLGSPHAKLANVCLTFFLAL